MKDIHLWNFEPFNIDSMENVPSLFSNNDSDKSRSSKCDFALVHVLEYVKQAANILFENIRIVQMKKIQRSITSPLFRVAGGERWERVAHEIVANLLLDDELDQWRIKVFERIFSLFSLDYDQHSRIYPIAECVFGSLKIDLYISDGKHELAIELKTRESTEFSSDQEEKYSKWLVSAEPSQRYFLLVSPKPNRESNRKIFSQTKSRQEITKVISWRDFVSCYLETFSKSLIPSCASWTQAEIEAYLLLLTGAMKI